MINSINTFPYFRPNQILRHTDLNDLIDYINSQNDTFRVLMVGMGVLSGYQVTTSQDGDGNDCINVSEGTGISSDGHFFQLDACVLKKFQEKKLNKNAFRCHVDPFTRCLEEGNENEDPLDIYELFEEDGPGEDINLDPDDPNNTFLEFYNNSVLVLLRCIGRQDRKLCINECDEQGSDVNVTIRKILVDKSELLAIEAEDNTPPNDDPTNPDPTPVSPPPFLPRFGYKPGEDKIDLTGVVGFDELRDCYLINYNTNPDLLASFESAFSAFTGGNQIVNRLLELNVVVSQMNSCNVQYFHDYMKDLILAYLEYEKYKCLAELVPEEQEPDFCKHPGYIKLGQPADFTGCRDNAQFSNFQQIDKSAQLQADYYKRRIECMILQGAVNLQNLPSEIRITPSRGKNYPLSERAIPYYYVGLNDDEDPTGTPIPGTGLRSKWKYDWRVKELYKRIPSYVDGGAEPPFMNHLYYDMDGYDFFRIEGHIGQNLTDVVGIIEDLRECQNLPFDIECVRLSDEPPSLRELTDCGKEPDCEDLEGLYREAKYDLICALWELDLSDFSELMIKRTQLISLLRGRASTFKQFCIEANEADFNEYYSEVDSQGNSLSNQIIVQNNPNPNSTEDCFRPVFEGLKAELSNRLSIFQFTNYVLEHPGLEHMAGVPKGGTFVLAYEERGEECIVKADFALPYYCCGGGSVPAPPKVEPLVVVSPREFCCDDDEWYEVTTYPTGGTLTGNLPPKTIDEPYLNQQGNKWFFNPSLVDVGSTGTIEELTLTYNCNNVISTTIVKIYKVEAILIEYQDKQEVLNNDGEVIGYKYFFESQSQPESPKMNLDWTTSQPHEMVNDDNTRICVFIPLDGVEKFTVRLEADLCCCKDISDEFEKKVCDLTADFSVLTKIPINDNDGNLLGYEYIVQNTSQTDTLPLSLGWGVIGSDGNDIGFIEFDGDKIRFFAELAVHPVDVTLTAAQPNDICESVITKSIPLEECPEPGIPITVVPEQSVRLVTPGELGTTIRIPLNLSPPGGVIILQGETDPYQYLDITNDCDGDICLKYTPEEADLPRTFTILYSFGVECTSPEATVVFQMVPGFNDPGEGENLRDNSESEKEESEPPSQDTINLLNQRRADGNAQIEELGQDTSLAKLSAFKQTKQFLLFPATDTQLNSNFEKAIKVLATNFGKAKGDRKGQYEQLIEVIIRDYLDKQIFLNPKALSEECQAVLKDCATRLKKAKFSIIGLRKFLVISKFGDFVSPDLIKQVNRILK